VSELVTVDALPGGVHRITLPIPWGISHVHAYAVADDDGWTLVDAGTGSEETVFAWVEALDALGNPPVRRIVITHYHPDHIGGAVALAELTGHPEIVQGTEDAAATRAGFGPGRDPEAAMRFLADHGVPDGFFGFDGRRRGGGRPSAVEPTRLVDEGDTIEIAGERYAVLHLPGHADGHIALLGERTGRMFGGDVLLEEITPNVSYFPGNRPDPLSDYLRTLDRIEQLRPSVVYPGHNGVIGDPAGRAAEIRGHHDERFSEHVAAIEGGATSSWEVANYVWRDSNLSRHEWHFALGEGVAHLIRLRSQGRIEETAPGRWRLAA
jgi:glyoxylase-like metal-dependent hydrolase (beta-lactamase superfamily II)